MKKRMHGWHAWVAPRWWATRRLITHLETTTPRPTHPITSWRYTIYVTRLLKADTELYAYKLTHPCIPYTPLLPGGGADAIYMYIAQFLRTHHAFEKIISTYHLPLHNFETLLRVQIAGFPQSNKSLLFVGAKCNTHHNFMVPKPGCRGPNYTDPPAREIYLGSTPRTFGTWSPPTNLI